MKKSSERRQQESLEMAIFDTQYLPELNNKFVPFWIKTFNTRIQDLT